MGNAFLQTWFAFFLFPFSLLLLSGRMPKGPRGGRTGGSVLCDRCSGFGVSRTTRLFFFFGLSWGSLGFHLVWSGLTLILVFKIFGYQLAFMHYRLYLGHLRNSLRKFLTRVRGELLRFFLRYPIFPITYNILL